MIAPGALENLDGTLVFSSQPRNPTMMNGVRTIALCYDAIDMDNVVKVQSGGTSTRPSTLSGR
jgi:hypothetical protein